MLSEYIISHVGLKEGEHVFDFEINNQFFESFELSEIKKGCLKAEVVLNKKAHVIELDFSITGHVYVPCDRCTENFEMPLSSTNRLLVKFGEDRSEENDELIVLSISDDEINVAQYLYEFIHLAIPYKRIHPEDENGETTCNEEMLEQIEEHLYTREESVDPRWNELKKLIK